MAHSSRRRPPVSSPRWQRFLLWGIPALVIFLIVAVVVARSLLASYLRSDAFREFVAGKAGATLHAECQLAPLHFVGLDFFSDDFSANGTPQAAFSKLGVEQLRANVSLRRFFEKVWQVDQFEVQQVRLDLTGPRAAAPEIVPPALPKKDNHEQPSFFSGWLPDRVEVGTALVRDLELKWAGGNWQRTAFEIKPREGGWEIEGQGGQIAQANLPPLDVQSLHLRYRGSTLFITQAELRDRTSGSLQTTGEVDFQSAAKIHAVLTNISVLPFLSPDWRVRLKGQLNGEVDVQAPLPLQGAAPRISGNLHLNQGELNALPILDQIATFTRTQQFRRLNLTRASGDFIQEAGRLQVSNFLLESEGLIRIEGQYTIQNGNIDGSFQVGVTPSSLQWLPGSQTGVFTSTHGGYVWAPMRLSGPVDKPSEDLSPRLVAAAQGAVIQDVKDAVQGGVKTSKDAVQGALDLIMPLVK